MNNKNSQKVANTVADTWQLESVETAVVNKVSMTAADNHYLTPIESAVVVAVAKKKRRPCGLRVEMRGALAFLPGSEIPERLFRKSAELVGQTIEVKVMSGSTPERPLVSMKAAEVERRPLVLSAIEVGSKITGVVQRRTPWGALLAIGPVTARLRFAGSQRVRFHIGDEVVAQVTSKNLETGTVNLKLRAGASS